jgi:hypothetical protein
MAFSLSAAGFARHATSPSSSRYFTKLPRSGHAPQAWDAGCLRDETAFHLIRTRGKLYEKMFWSMSGVRNGVAFLPSRAAELERGHAGQEEGGWYPTDFRW